MSRAYRISVSGSVDRIVHIDDGVCTSLELLPVLGKDRMRDLLGDELARRGFVREGTTAKRTMDAETTVEVDLDTGSVTVRVTSEVAVNIERDATTIARTQPTAAARDQLQKKLDAELEQQAREETERARRKMTAQLEAKLRDLKQELDGVVNRVTGEALKEKARQMGEIEELIEDEKTGALTIKVKL